jgi:hypothetical protein
MVTVFHRGLALLVNNDMNRELAKDGLTPSRAHLEKDAQRLRAG